MRNFVISRPSNALPAHRKQSLYFPSEMLREIEREATRIDRSLSWIVQRCLRTGLQEIKRLPSTQFDAVSEEESEAASRAEDGI